MDLETLSFTRDFHSASRKVKLDTHETSR